MRKEIAEACIKMVEKSWISNYNGFVFLSQEEEPLMEDEIKDGLEGFYAVVLVKEASTDKLFKAYVRCCDGFEYYCSDVVEV